MITESNKLFGEGECATLDVIASLASRRESYGHRLTIKVLLRTEILLAVLSQMKAEHTQNF